MPDHVESIVIGIAMAVYMQMLNVNCINLARGKTLTVTTAMIDTKKPKDVYTSETAVLW